MTPRGNSHRPCQESGPCEILRPTRVYLEVDHGIPTVRDDIKGRARMRTSFRAAGKMKNLLLVPRLHPPRGNVVGGSDVDRDVEAHPWISHGGRDVWKFCRELDRSPHTPFQHKKPPTRVQGVSQENICRDEPADPSLLIPCPFCPPAELLSSFLPPSFMSTYSCDSFTSIWLYHSASPPLLRFIHHDCPSSARVPARRLARLRCVTA